MPSPIASPATPMAPSPDRLAFLDSLSQHARLIELETPFPEAAFVAEKFSGREAISELYRFDIDCLSTSAHFELKRLIGEELTLRLLQADGGKRAWHGIVTEASQLGGDGSLARYRLTLEPWLAELRYRRDCRILQDKNAIELVEAVFERYPRRRLEIKVSDAVLAELPKYPIATQYRESDLDFVLRILARDGLSWTIEHDQQSGQGGEHSRHSLVIVDAGHDWPECPQGRIRYHRLSATESEDGIHRISPRRQIQPNRVTVAAWDERSLAGHSAEASGTGEHGELPELEQYHAAGQKRYRDPQDAERQARLRQGAQHLAAKAWEAESSVRRLGPGQRFQLTGYQEDALNSNPQLLVLAIEHHAANNLDGGMRRLLNASEQEAGTYRNQLTLVRADTPILPAPPPPPAIDGLHSALVVGVDGEALTTDRDLRIKIQFPWQRGAKPNPGGLQSEGDHAPGDETAGTWVRVAQSGAGPNWGAQFTPRIGAEVLVEYLEGDPDQPIVVGSLHNGQDQLPFAAGQDSGTNHPGVIAGYHSQTHDGQHHAQWIADDAPGQVRTRLAASQNQSQVNLGHLIQQSPDTAQRGGYRGEGFELATDGWATMRGAQGLFITTSARPNGVSTQLDTQETRAQLKAAQELGQTLSDAASGQNAQGLPAQKQSLDKLLKAIDPKQDGQYTGAVGGQATTQATDNARSGGDPVERFAAPLIVADTPTHLILASPASTALHAGGNLASVIQGDTQLGAAHTVSTVSGKTTSLYTHEGGLKAIAANGPLSLQAHTDKLEVLADKSVTVTSTNDEIEILANSKIRLVAGQSEIVLEGSDITFKCPGTWEAKGSSHGMAGAASDPAGLPALPAGGTGIDRAEFKDNDEAFQLLGASSGKPLANVAYEIDSPTGLVAGSTDDNGMTERVYTGSAAQAVQVKFKPAADVEDFADGTSELC